MIFRDRSIHCGDASYRWSDEWEGMFRQHEPRDVKFTFWDGCMGAGEDVLLRRRLRKQANEQKRAKRDKDKEARKEQAKSSKTDEPPPYTYRPRFSDYYVVLNEETGEISSYMVTFNEDPQGQVLQCLKTRKRIVVTNFLPGFRWMNMGYDNYPEMAKAFRRGTPAERKA